MTTGLEKSFLSADDAAARIGDGRTMAIGGSGSGHCIPDILLEALGRRFTSMGHPNRLTLVHAFGVGDQKSRGLQHLAQPGLFRRVIGGHWSMAPQMSKLAAANEFEAYNVPAGVVVQLFHAAAAGSPGWMTEVGLGTFIDPRLEGGKLNAAAQEDIVELIERNGREYLFYPAIPIDVALIQGSTADEHGNIGMNREAGFWHNCAMAQAARTAGGITIAVVKERVAVGGIHARDVRVPGCFVDFVVVDPHAGQTFQTHFEPAYSGDSRKPDSEFGGFPLNARKVIARRAALELAPGTVLNVGFGVPDGVMKVAREQGIAGTLVPTIEHGQFGGIPAEGLDFGATYNSEAILETGHMFDFYQGRGVDQAYLGFLEIDREGNVNVSKLADTIIGTGGFHRYCPEGAQGGFLRDAGRTGEDGVGERDFALHEPWEAQVHRDGESSHVQRAIRSDPWARGALRDGSGGLPTDPAGRAPRGGRAGNRYRTGSDAAVGLLALDGRADGRDGGGVVL